MGALKKYEDFFKENKEEESSDKEIVSAYQRKISELLTADPSIQEKAAHILSMMINKK